jgi:hypothetical protein
MELTQAREQATERVSIDDQHRAATIDSLVTEGNLPQIRLRVEALAHEYESIRASDPSNDDRTRAMAEITSQMRALGRAAYPLRWEFAFSPSPGRRLGALTMLQVQPDVDMIEWVAGRVSVMESSYVQYQALQALSAAVWLGDRSNANRIFRACARARDAWKNMPADARTERGDLLEDITKKAKIRVDQIAIT